MKKWLHTSLVAAASAILVLVILLILKRCFKRKPRNDAVSDAERSPNFQNGITRLHQVSPHHLDPRNSSSKNANYQQLFKRGVSTKSAPVFSWGDHPSLITDAVENGWSRFAFAAFAPSPSVKSTRSVLGACGARDSENDKVVEIGWEVCEGSADFLQKIRLNSNMMKSASVVRTVLPLPGPNLGNASFPQEAYFEITILGLTENGFDQFGDGKKSKKSGDKIKLIGEDFNAKNSPDLGGKIEQLKIGKSEKDHKDALLWVGLTGGSQLPLRIPGSFAGSVGFNSSGSVFLDGTKLVPNSENYEWGRTDKVVGCGYNPGQKKVFFTIDSQVVHEIHCRKDDFGSPMYPTLAANTDVTVLVNLGQSPFKYGPANLQRTPNPCFVGPMTNSPSLGYDDSRELFSMGRIDSQWLQRSTTNARSNNNTVNSLKSIEYDQESEGDLFEIVLDSTGRSPYTFVHNQ